MNTRHAPCVVWCFNDGKPGHENQSRGLLRALAALHPLSVHAFTPLPAPQALWCWLTARFPGSESIPDPALVIGAGHATHLSILAARRARGGRSVVLMKPSLPTALFDLCIVPEHDRMLASRGVLRTRGVLNVVQTAARKLERRGLMLIGGPSRHFHWSNETALSQIMAISQRDAGWQWTVASSRRTPQALERELEQLRVPNLTFVSWRTTGPEWLPWRLAETPRVWVSEDSVSMVYEALTAGAAVGLIAVPRRGRNRISQGIDGLVAERLLTTFAAWQAGHELVPPAVPFNEAERCAQWIHGQWLSGR